MNNNIILHVSEVNVTPQSGMGRIEYYWKNAIEQAGYTFIHIGPNEVGPLKHPALFPAKAYKYYKKLKIKPKAFIIHEPASGYFVNRGIPCFIESHGIERRYWEAQLNGSVPPTVGNKISSKTKILFPLWRLRGCEKGLKNATKLLLSNSDDREFAKLRYGRSDEDIMIFKNGASAVPTTEVAENTENFTVLFNATWQLRKGYKTLVQAAEVLYARGLIIHYLLIGTGKDQHTILNDWPPKLHPFVKVVGRFTSDEENKYLASSSLFVLPSYFEGQPLSLLQAMAAGKCCITTNCCGQKDVINNKNTGLLFEPGDFTELASLIEICYRDRYFLTRIGSSAKKHVNDLTWENVSKQVADFVLTNVV